MMLETNRLILRAAKANDLMDLHAIFRSPEAMKYWSTAPHDSPAHTQENLTGMIESAAERLVYFVIEMNGRVIGTAGVHKDDEVGFILHPDHWRQGIVTEAMSAIIPHLFAVTDVERLTADADPLNEASVNCLKKLGFTETHREKNTFFINGVWSDSVYLSLPRPA